MNSLSRLKVYWICQIGGWALYGFISALLYIFANKINFTIKEAASIFFMCLFAIAYTHAYRYILKRWNWTALSLTRLILQVLLASIALGSVFVLSNYVVGELIGVNEQVAISAGIVIFVILNASLLFLFWSLIYFAMFFFTNYKKEEIERLQWEKSIKDFELNKLKSQLNPHFVFNALNTIRALVDEDPRKAKTSITQLSNILRNSLIADRNKTITLEEELRTVNDYLNLEKIRYEERLNVRMDIEPETLHIQVPPMMIQTLAENAVKHGISKKLSGGFISIECRLEKNKLVVSIKNTGQLERINSGGFGILNTRQRLELLYGSENYFDISQEDNDVVNARLNIPIL
jgi:two-component system LytT family sensor kinase